MTGLDRIRLRCQMCESEWEVWGNYNDLRRSFAPEGGFERCRCPDCGVVTDHVVEINGEEPR